MLMPLSRGGVVMEGEGQGKEIWCLDCSPVLPCVSTLEGVSRSSTANRRGSQVPGKLLVDGDITAASMADLFFPTMPRQPLHVKHLFLLRSWQGIGWLRLLFVFGWLWSLLLTVSAIVFSLIGGDLLSILSSVILGPLFFLVSVIVLRVLVEVLLSILLLPHVLRQKPSSSSRCDLQGFDSNNSELSLEDPSVV